MGNQRGNEMDAMVEIATLKELILDLAKHIACGTASKIHAIKAYRTATGAPLKDSKDWVEALANAKALQAMGDSRIQNLEDRVYRLEQATFPVFKAQTEASQS